MALNQVLMEKSAASILICEDDIHHSLAPSRALDFDAVLAEEGVMEHESRICMVQADGSPGEVSGICQILSSCELFNQSHMPSQASW